MKKLLTALSIILLMAGIAAGIMYRLGIGPFEGLAWVEDEQAEEDEAEVKKPFFVKLDALALPLIKENKVIGNIQLAIELEAYSLEAKRAISHAKPRLNDAFLRDLHRYIPQHLRREPQIDILVIKKRLKKVGDRVLGPGVLRGVLVQGVVENQPR